MEDKFFISAAVVTYNDGEKALNTCKSIIEHTLKYPLKLYVFDNASTDSTADMLSSLDGVTVIRNHSNRGFGAAHNQILNQEMGKYHFVINPDIQINSDVLSALTDCFEENPDIAMMMPKILNADGTEQFLPKERPTFKRLFLGRLAKLGGIFRKIRNEYTWSDKKLNGITDINFCSGSFFGIRADIYKKLRGFDERFFMYLEDAELTLRAEKLGRTVINPFIEVTHLWKRESAKKLKYLMIHISSSFKFLLKVRKENL